MRTYLEQNRNHQVLTEKMKEEILSTTESEYLDDQISEENCDIKIKNDTELASVICNCCNKELRVENGILKDECIHISHAFGYFSERDGETQCFDLCEECYDKIIAKFRTPVEKEERTELL